MDVKGLLGDAGELKRVMKYDVSDDGARISNFEYKPNTLSKYGRIFFAPKSANTAAKSPAFANRLSAPTALS
jgi:hypothetical protein